MGICIELHSLDIFYGMYIDKDAHLYSWLNMIPTKLLHPGLATCAVSWFRHGSQVENEAKDLPKDLKA